MVTYQSGWSCSLSIRPSYGAKGEEILDGEGGGGEEKGKFLSFTSLPFSLPFFPFSPETPDTQASEVAALKQGKAALTLFHVSFI